MAGADLDSGSRGRAKSPLWRRFPTWLAIFLFCLPIYLLTLPGDLRNNADTVDRFMVTSRLLHGTVAVACPTPGERGPADARLVIGRHGCYYAIYGPGQTILMTPLYLVGKALATVTEPYPTTGHMTAAAKGANLAHDALDEAIAARMLDPLLGGLALIIFFLIALELGYSRRTAIVLSLALGVASSVFPDVQSGQEQIQSTLALLALTFSVLRYRRAATRDRWRWLLAAGLSAGFGLFTRYDFWVVLAAFGAVLAVAYGGEIQSWWRSRTRPDRWTAFISGCAPFLLGLLPFLAIDAAWNTLRFGAPWNVGQSITDQFGTPIWQGVPNLLLSPGKGLIWYVPLLWLAPFAYRRFYRRSALVWWIGIAGLVASLLFYGIVKYWHGDPGWGPRYLFPVVPLLLLPVGEVFERFRQFRWQLRTGILAVMAISLGVQVLAVSVDTWRFWYHLVEVRQDQHVAFNFYPSTYDYYWSSDPSLSPVIYQLAAVVDVARIGQDRRMGIPEATVAQNNACQNVPMTHVFDFDRCKLDGLSLRPLNTVSSIWLSDRYQFEDAGPFPLQLVWRALIVGGLGLLALAAGAILHLQFWRQPPEERKPDT